MNGAGGAATQVCSDRFDRRFFALPKGIQDRVQARIDNLGHNLRGFSHYRMKGSDGFRLRVGDYRVIYQFNVERNELYLITLGHRRDVYEEPLS